MKSKWVKSMPAWTELGTSRRDQFNKLLRKAFKAEPRIDLPVLWEEIRVISEIKTFVSDVEPAP